MTDEIIDVVDFDEEEEEADDEYYRNARRGRRGGRFPPPRRGTRRRSRAIVVRPTARALPVPAQSRSPIVHKYGTLKWGLIADAGAKALAAIQPLPGAPSMGADPAKNLQNMVDYQAALAGHAKRSQQLTTLGSIAKVFLP